MPVLTLVPVLAHGVACPDGDVGEEAEAVGHGGIVLVGYHAGGAGMVARWPHCAERIAGLRTSMSTGVSVGSNKTQYDYICDIGCTSPTHNADLERKVTQQIFRHVAA